jgi:hypothetical protein
MTQLESLSRSLPLAVLYHGVHLFTADSSATLSNNSAALVFNLG